MEKALEALRGEIFVFDDDDLHMLKVVPLCGDMCILVLTLRVNNIVLLCSERITM